MIRDSGERGWPGGAVPVSFGTLARLLLRDPLRSGPAGSPQPPPPGPVASLRRLNGPFDDRPIGDRTIDVSTIIVDIRSRQAYLRGHIPGAISIPWQRLPRSLFLLPPREHSLLLVGRDGAAAAAAARFLITHGRSRVTWLDGSPRDLPRGMLRPGREVNRAWEPAPLLRELIARLPRTGEAIDLACGSGREAAFLALHRQRVLGVDILPDALLQARALARAAGVAPGRLTLRRADLTDSRAVADLLRPRRFRVILCFRYLDRALLPAIARALAPGGWVIHQAFLEAQARAGRKPKRSAFLLKPDELRGAFESADGIEILHYSENEDARGDHLASLVGRAAVRRRGDLSSVRDRPDRAARTSSSISIAGSTPTPNHPGSGTHPSHRDSCGPVRAHVRSDPRIPRPSDPHSSTSSRQVRR